jgi:hypothetical protein
MVALSISADNLESPFCNVIKPGSISHHTTSKFYSPSSSSLNRPSSDASPLQGLQSPSKGRSVADCEVELDYVCASAKCTFPSPYDHIMRPGSQKPLLVPHNSSVSLNGLNALQLHSFSGPGSQSTSEGSGWVGTPASSVSSDQFYSHSQMHSNVHSPFDAFQMSSQQTVAVSTNEAATSYLPNTDPNSSSLLICSTGQTMVCWSK